MEMILIVFLCLLGCLQSTPSTTYVSYMSKISRSRIPSAPSILVTELMDSDDSPFFNLKLPFSFPYFGWNIENVYLSPNGVIQTNPYQSCSCRCFMDQTCNFNNSYLGQIAALLSDLDFSASSSSKLTYSSTNSTFTVSYVLVPYFFSPTTLNTFSISLFSDGHVEIFYDNINAPLEPSINMWLSGLRAPNRTQYAVFSASQRAAGLEWRSTAPGVYPPHNLVVSGNQFIACPLSTTVCASNSSIDVADFTSSSIPVLLNLTALTLSCQTQIQLGLVLWRSTKTGGVNATTVVPCISNAEDHVGVTLSCDLAVLLRNNSVPFFLATTGAVNVSLYWRATDSKAITGTSFSIIDTIEPVKIEVYNSSSSTMTSVCHNNQAVDSCSASSCGACDGSSSCLSLPCIDSPSNAGVLSLYSLYATPSCAGTCDSNVFFDEKHSICCNVSDLDCFGNCFGTASIVTQPTGVTICCEQSDVDCAGACSGGAAYDVCGVCEGTASQLSDCTDSDSRLQPGAMWPTFGRNQKHNSASPFQATNPIEVNDSNPFASPIWSLALCPSTKSSPVIDYKGVIYIGCDNGWMYAISEDSFSGEPLVKESFHAGAAISTTAALDDRDQLLFGTVGTSMTQSQFIALDAATFDVVWRINILGSVKSSPCLYGGMAFIGSGDTQKLYAIDTETGTVLWSATLTGVVYSAPAVSGGVVYVHTAVDYSMYAYNIYTGTLLVKVSVGSFSFPNINPSPPTVLQDGTVLVGSTNGIVVRYRPRSTTNSQVSAYAFYSTPSTSSIQAAVVVDSMREVVFVSSASGNVHAVHLNNGSLSWTLAAGSSVVNTGALAINSGVLYVGTSAGKLLAVRASTGSVLWSLIVDSAISNIAISGDGTIVFASASGRVYRAGGSSVVCSAGTGISRSFNASSLSANIPCSACSEGHSSRRSACSPCSPGLFSNASNAANCQSCMPGKYSPLYEATAQETCVAGTYSSYRASKCADCAAGTYSSSSASTCTSCSAGKLSYPKSFACSACTAGSYTGNTTGASACTPCPIGSYGYRVDGPDGLSGTCALCPAGKYSFSAGSTSCTSCAPGLAALSDGLTACSACPYGRYPSADSSSCPNCPWPRFSTSSSDPCQSYVMMFGYTIVESVSVIYIFWVGITVASIVMTIEPVVRADGFLVVTKLGFSGFMFFAWIEQTLQTLYFLNIPFSSEACFVLYGLVLLVYPVIGYLVLLRSSGAIPVNFKSFLRMLPTGIVLFCFKGFAASSVWNNFFRALTRSRSLDRQQPIDVRTSNLAHFFGIVCQTIPILVIQTYSRDYEASFNQSLLINCMVTVSSVALALQILRSFHYWDRSLSGHPMVVVFGSYTALLVTATEENTIPVVPAPITLDGPEIETIVFATADMVEVIPNPRGRQRMARVGVGNPGNNNNSHSNNNSSASASAGAAAASASAGRLDDLMRYFSGQSSEFVQANDSEVRDDIDIENMSHYSSEDELPRVGRGRAVVVASRQQQEEEEGMEESPAAAVRSAVTVEAIALPVLQSSIAVVQNARVVRD